MESTCSYDFVIENLDARKNVSVLRVLEGDPVNVEFGVVVFREAVPLARPPIEERRQ